MTDREEILQIFKKTNALMEGHFQLTSGLHSDKYMQCAKVFQYPEFAEVLARQLALSFEEDGVEIVIGPALGGIILAYEVARSIGVKNIFAERENGIMVLRRGFELPKNTRVLVVEDVVTTGGSVREVMELVASMGSMVVGVGSLVDRSQGLADFGVKFRALLSMKVQSHAPDSCPLCLLGIPIVKPGSRKIV
ncbi:MAG TPA: orotate phosphoribosyltransferase [Clostridia bacterium]|nr:orotate phosphoribosyltransferase [Clostridia bacterium]